MNQTTKDALSEAAPFFAFMLVFSLGFGAGVLSSLQDPASAPKADEPPKAHHFNFTVVDSIGRRFRPVPCLCDEPDHTGCGNLYRADHCDELDSAQQKVTVIYPNNNRHKKRIFEVENYTPPCGYDHLRPNFRLERIIN